MDAEKRSSMFQAVQEIKAQRSFGTVEAVRYLKDRERYDSLMEVVKKVAEDRGGLLDSEADLNLLKSVLDFRRGGN